MNTLPRLSRLAAAGSAQGFLAELRVCAPIACFAALARWAGKSVEAGGHEHVVDLISIPVYATGACVLYLLWSDEVAAELRRVAMHVPFIYAALAVEGTSHLTHATVVLPALAVVDSFARPFLARLALGARLARLREGDVVSLRPWNAVGSENSGRTYVVLAPSSAPGGFVAVASRVRYQVVLDEARVLRGHRDVQFGRLLPTRLGPRLRCLGRCGAAALCAAYMETVGSYVHREERRVLDAYVERALHAPARRIQAAWRAAVTDPRRAVCRARLLREAAELDAEICVAKCPMTEQTTFQTTFQTTVQTTV